MPDPEPLCASTDEMILQTSILMRSNVILMTSLAICTFLLTQKALKILEKRPIFHKSTRILILVSLGFVNFHDFALMYIQIFAFIRSFVFQNEPCKIMRSTEECRWQNHCLITGIAGITLTQSALSLERLIATIIPQKYSKLGKSPGILLSIFVTLSSIIAPLIIVWGDPHTDTVPNCFFFPVESANRANMFLIIMTVILIVSIFMNLFIICINKKLEMRDRFHVDQRYQKREALISTRIVCFIAIAQFIGLAFYSSTVLTLRLHKHLIPVSVYHNIVWWAYTVPFAAVSLPAILMYRIKQVGKFRKKIINRITTKVETQEEHMKSLKLLWG